MTDIFATSHIVEGLDRLGTRDTYYFHFFCFPLKCRKSLEKLHSTPYPLIQLSFPNTSVIRRKTPESFWIILSTIRSQQSKVKLPKKPNCSLRKFQRDDLWVQGKSSLKLRMLSIFRFGEVNYGHFQPCRQTDITNYVINFSNENLPDTWRGR